jgi:succinate-semialdehyde dehydrogenase / glutarate-semialdehyde dehydrogenase
VTTTESQTDTWTAADLVDGTIGDLSSLIEVVDPATGRPCGHVSHVNGADAADRARRAADAAARTLPAWSETPPRARADLLLRAVALLADRIGEIARILAVEAGKRLPEAEAEVRFSSEYLRWFAEEIRRPHGEFFTSEDRARRQLSFHRPLGVVASLTPWNFPVSIQARKIAPALAAGCTVVARVSEKAPLAVTRWLTTLHEAGLPDGVLNLVHGDARTITGTWLDHPSVRGVSFTGSTQVGAQIMTQAARRIVRPMLELGGNAPFVVHADADLDVALTQAELGKLRNAGQSCVGVNRFLVHASIADEFGTRLAERFDQLSLGPGTDTPVPDLGPVIDQDRVTAVTGLIEEAVTTGGRRLTAERDLPSDGFWVAPTLVADVPADCRLATEEVFGPAAGIFTFDTDEEAARLANSTEMGLAAYVFTRDAGRAFRFAEQLDAGIVGINDALPSVAFTPMGGTKQSGLGREGGTEGLREFQETTYLAWRP